MNVGLILAGGVGSRVGAPIPKQFVRVFGKPILAYTLDIFECNKNIDAIEIVSHKDWVKEIYKIIKAYGISKARWVCTGGKTFQESVMNGVFNLKGTLKSEDIVVVSFGVSPLTPDSDIDDSIRVCKRFGNAIASKDLDLCTCIKDDDFSSTKNILRETLKGFSNPWTFQFGELCDAYARAQKTGLLETLEPHTTSLYFALGKRLYFSQSTTPLAKITTRQDLEIFNALVTVRMREPKRLDEGMP